MEDRQVRQLVARAEMLLGQVEELEDAQARSVAIEAVQVLFELYGEGLLRIRDYVAGPDGGRFAHALKQDELISHLFLMHGIHPDDVETRVQQALEEVRPYMASHGGNVELLGVQEGVAHLRLVGSCHGCAASSTTMKLAVEKAVQKYAPDLMGIDAEGAVDSSMRDTAGFVPVTALGTAQVLKQDV